MNGILNVLKPAGMSSSDVVVDVRRLTHIKRVGHCGTLDPGGAGVLNVCIGRATRLFDYLMPKSKSYRFEVLFGVQTDTLDSYGSVLQREAVRVTQAQVLAALPQLKGSLFQMPPMYSAIKHNGRKLYQLARAGEAFDLQSKGRDVQIYDLSLVAQTGENTFLFDADCSKGTYVRVLGQQIAQKLGTIATVTFLMRVRSGAFTVQDCISIAQARELMEQGQLQSRLVPMDKAFYAPCLQVQDDLLHRLANGNAIEREKTICIQAPELFRDYVALENIYKVYCQDQFIGVGYYEQDWLKIKTMLVDREELGC